MKIDLSERCAQKGRGAVKQSGLRGRAEERRVPETADARQRATNR